MSTPSKPASLGPFLGLSNRRADDALASMDRRVPGDYLARAENVDISNQGTVKRRAGYARVQPGADCHSLWSRGADAFYADGADLKRARGEGTSLSVSTIFSGLPVGRFLSFAHDGVNVIFTDGVTNRRIVDDGPAPLAPPALAAFPSMVGSTGGALPAGSYQACFTYLDADGREGPATPAIDAAVATNGKLLITGLPTSFPAGVVALEIYLTPVNGETLLRAAALTTPQASYTVAVLPSLGGRCMTRHMLPLPAGTIMRFVNGRALVAAGSVVFYSEPFAPGLYRPESGYVPFPDQVTTIETTSTGVYIATTEASYFIKGDIAGADLKTVLPYGAVPRTGGPISTRDACWWMSTKGVVVGDNNGDVTNRQEAEVAVDPALVGAGLYREKDGVRQIIAGTFGTRQSGAAVGSWAEAEVIHKESA